MKAGALLFAVSVVHRALTGTQEVFNKYLWNKFTMNGDDIGEIYGRGWNQEMRK